MDKQRALTILTGIQEDCERDAGTIDGKPFNGRTTGEQFGHILAMIASLAHIVEKHLTEDHK